MLTKQNINLRPQPVDQSYRIRSYVGRNSRKTDGQTRALAELWPQYGLSLNKSPYSLEKVFGNTHPCYLEIGFGMGHSLLEAALTHPNKNFIGVETHKPGIGALLLQAQRKQISNLRVFNSDAIDVLEHSIAESSLAGVQIFFPDPWQKRRHHERRLIQNSFLDLLSRRLMPQASLHLATDWEDYAQHMMKVVSSHERFENLSGKGQYAARSAFRPVISKFEARALKEGRTIWEIQLIHKP